MVDPCVPFSLSAVNRDFRDQSGRVANCSDLLKSSSLRHKQHLSHPLVCLGMQSILLTDGDSRGMSILGSYSHGVPKPAEIRPRPKRRILPFARRHGRKGKCFGSSRISEGEAAYPGLSLCVLGEVYRALDAVLGGSARNLRWTWASDCPASASLRVLVDKVGG